MEQYCVRSLFIELKVATLTVHTTNLKRLFTNNQPKKVCIVKYYILYIVFKKWLALLFVLTSLFQMYNEPVFRKFVLCS